MTAAHHHPHHPHEHPKEESFIFAAWKAADQCVPWPYLLYWVAEPPAGSAAATLNHLTEMDFVYGTPVDFMVLLGLRNGAFTQAIVERRRSAPGEPRLMPIAGTNDFNYTPEKAEERIEHYLRRQDHRFWEHLFLDLGVGAPEIAKLKIEPLLERYRRLSWRSLRVERPFFAGVIEPRYLFRKAGCRCEFLVGVQTGTVTHRHFREFAPPPIIKPPQS